MKKFAPMLALLAFLPVANPAHAFIAPKSAEPVAQQATAKIRIENPNKPKVYLSATGICGPHPTLTQESAAEGDTLVISYTFHTRACQPSEATYMESRRETIDLVKEARAVGITAAKPKLKATIKLVHDQGKTP